MKLIIRFIFVIIAIFFIDITVYAYTAYKVGDEITYNGINYYVIKDSGIDEDSVTLLKAEPLTVEEVNLYGGVGTENNHVNMYATSDTSASYYHKAYDINGYGGMAYYSSENCRFSDGVHSHITDECTTSYEQSEIKYVVDAWAESKVGNGLVESRIITYDDLTDNLGYIKSNDGTIFPSSNGNTPTWVYNTNYNYWTMSSYDDSNYKARTVHGDGCILVFSVVYQQHFVVRPVITLKKTALVEETENIKEDTVEVLPDNENNVDKKETTTKLKVENTYMSQTLIIMIIGFISICSGVVIFYIIKNKKIISRCYL